jgi:hypothetical protein
MRISEDARMTFDVEAQETGDEKILEGTVNVVNACSPKIRSRGNK